MSDNPPIERREMPGGHRYVSRMEDDSLARLNVVHAAPGHWIADSTFVPEPYRGRDIAEEMVARLVADAREAGARITPTCWFVADEFERMAPAWDDVRMG